MEAIKISSFGRNEIQNAEWYATSIEELIATEGSCIGDKGYLLVENMPMYIKKDNKNNQKDWQFVGNKYGGGGGGSLPNPIPYEYMPDGYPKVETVKEYILSEELYYDDNGDRIFYADSIEEPVVLVPGEKYVVIINDSEYVCEVSDMHYNEQFYRLWNDQMPWSVDFAKRTSYGWLGRMTCDDINYTHNTVTLSISKMTYEKITPIAEKFLPTGTGGSSALSEADALALLVETDVVQPVANEQNTLYTDEYDRTFVL